MLFEKDIIETLTHLDIRVADLTERLRPLEKLGMNIDMVGKWLIKNTDRIKILEQRVGEIIRGNVHTEQHYDTILEDLQKQIYQHDEHLKWLLHQGPESAGSLGLQRQIDRLNHRTEGMGKLVGRVNTNSVGLIDMQALIDDIHDAMPAPTDGEILVKKIMEAKIPEVCILVAINARIKELEDQVETVNGELGILLKYRNEVRK